MPYILERVPNTKTRYSVVNKLTNEVHSKSTSLKKAKAQIRLLEMLDHTENGSGLLETFDKNDKKSPVELISFDTTQLTVKNILLRN